MLSNDSFPPASSNDGEYQFPNTPKERPEQAVLLQQLSTNVRAVQMSPDTNVDDHVSSYNLLIPTNTHTESFSRDASVERIDVKKRKKLSPKKTSTNRLRSRRKREEELVALFLSHMSEAKRTPDITNILIDRMKSFKIMTFDYYDEYTRNWFMQIYGLNKNLHLNKLNISSDMIFAFLKKKYSKLVTEKILTALNLHGYQSEMNFTNYLGSIKTNMMAKGTRDQLRFCFNLFDHDGDGYISPTDLDVFNKQYTGTCSLLATDFLAIAKMLNLKRAHPDYHHRLSRVPMQTASNRMSKRTPAYGTNASVSPNKNSSSPIQRKQSKLNIDSLKLSPEPKMQRLSSIQSAIDEEPNSSQFKRKPLLDQPSLQKRESSIRGESSMFTQAAQNATKGQLRLMSKQSRNQDQFKNVTLSSFEQQSKDSSAGPSTGIKMRRKDSMINQFPSENQSVLATTTACTKNEGLRLQLDRVGGSDLNIGSVVNSQVISGGVSLNGGGVSSTREQHRQPASQQGNRILLRRRQMQQTVIKPEINLQMQTRQVSKRNSFIEANNLAAITEQRRGLRTRQYNPRARRQIPVNVSLTIESEDEQPLSFRGRQISQRGVSRGGGLLTQRNQNNLGFASNSLAVQSDPNLGIQRNSFIPQVASSGHQSLASSTNMRFTMRNQSSVDYSKPLTARNQSKVNESWITINVSEHSDLNKVDLRKEMKKKREQLDSSSQRRQKTSVPLLPQRRKVPRISIGSNNNAKVMNVNSSQTIGPESDQQQSLTRVPSTKQDALASLKAFLPEKTLNYMQRRERQKETLFTDYIGRQILAKEEIVKRFKEENEKRIKKGLKPLEPTEEEKEIHRSIKKRGEEESTAKKAPYDYMDGGEVDETRGKREVIHDYFNAFMKEKYADSDTEYITFEDFYQMHEEYFTYQGTPVIFRDILYNLLGYFYAISENTDETVTFYQRLIQDNKHYVKRKEDIEYYLELGCDPEHIHLAEILYGERGN